MTRPLPLHWVPNAMGWSTRPLLNNESVPGGPRLAPGSHLAPYVLVILGTGGPSLWEIRDAREELQEGGRRQRREPLAHGRENSPAAAKLRAGMVYEAIAQCIDHEDCLDNTALALACAGARAEEAEEENEIPHTRSTRDLRDGVERFEEARLRHLNEWSEITISVRRVRPLGADVVAGVLRGEEVESAADLVRHIRARWWDGDESEWGYVVRQESTNRYVNAGRIRFAADPVVQASRAAAPSRTLTATAGTRVTGGGDLSTDRTFVEVLATDPQTEHQEENDDV